MLHRPADVRAAAAIPAIGLLAGSACGLLAADVPLTAGLTLLVVCGLTAGVGWWAQRSRVLAAAVGLAFFVGGALLAGDAWHRVWHSSLRTAFEELARADRAEAAAVGRTPPEQKSAFAIVTGTLTADATPSPSGGSLSIDVDELKGVVPLFREAAAGKGYDPFSLAGFLPRSSARLCPSAWMNGGQAAECVFQSSCGARRGTSIRACPITNERWPDAGRSWLVR